MERKTDPNLCIRIFRDEQQINRCRERLLKLDASVSEMSKWLQLAGNSVRMKILFLLREEKRLCVCDLSEILRMKIPAVSQHLRKLKDGGFVFTEREGTTIYYQINKEKVSLMKIIFSLLPELELA